MWTITWPLVEGHGAGDANFTAFYPFKLPSWLDFSLMNLHVAQTSLVKRTGYDFKGKINISHIFKLVFCQICLEMSQIRLFFFPTSTSLVSWKTELHLPKA